MDGTPAGHLLEALLLSIAEYPVKRDAGLDSVDPTILSFVALGAVVGVHPVELEHDVDRG